ncbi:Ig-like domain (group 3) [Micrococcales bacterium KH10]|nr:Ig-like domain (group 3) [Micrococcales bacterium KH10]
MISSPSAALRKRAMIAVAIAMVLALVPAVSTPAAASTQTTASGTVVQAQATVAAPNAEAQKKSKITVKMVKKTVAWNERVRVRIKVKAPGVARPTGLIKLTAGPYTYYTTMKKKHKGALVFKTPYYLADGKYKVKAEYLGTAKIAPSKTKKAAKFKVKPAKISVSFNF